MKKNNGSGIANSFFSLKVKIPKNNAIHANPTIDSRVIEVEALRAELRQQQEAFQKTEKERDAHYKRRESASQLAEANLEEHHAKLKQLEADLSKKEQNVRKNIQDKHKQTLAEIENLKVELHQQQETSKTTEAEREAKYKSRESALQQDKADIDKRHAELKQLETALKGKEQNLKDKEQTAGKNIQNRHNQSIVEIEKFGAELRQQQEAFHTAEKERDAHYKSRDDALQQVQADLNERSTELKKLEAGIKDKEQQAKKSIQAHQKQSLMKIEKLKVGLRRQRETLQTTEKKRGMTTIRTKRVLCSRPKQN